MSDTLLTVKQFAERFQVSEVTVRRWIAMGIIKNAIQITKRSGWRIPESEAERLRRESS